MNRPSLSLFFSLSLVTTDGHITVANVHSPLRGIEYVSGFSQNFGPPVSGGNSFGCYFGIGFDCRQIKQEKFSHLVSLDVLIHIAFFLRSSL